MLNKINYRLFNWGVEIPVKESWNYAHTIYVLTEGGAIYKQEKDRNVVEYYIGHCLPDIFYEDPGNYDIWDLILKVNPFHWAYEIFQDTDDYYIATPSYCYMSDDVQKYIKGLEEEIKELREENAVIHKSNRQKNLEAKDTPTKFKIKNDTDGRVIWVCPRCGRTLVKFWSDVETIRPRKYCDECGQALEME